MRNFILLLLAASALAVAGCTRKPVYDIVVAQDGTGDYTTVSEAVRAAPDDAEEPVKIFIKNGIYREKVIIDKPHICLIGEDRDSTRIIFAELASDIKIKRFNGQRVGNGVIVLLEGADDCLITGLTVYNDYGTTVEDTRAHQMAIYGRATRTIVVNANVWADGNDALSLWAPNAGGMYYHADLDLRCRGVDFLCPRGWCYATRCRFFGNRSAQIWHDGRGDRSKKLVVTDSRFDAANDCPLGRYHHDAQFFLVNCSLSDKIMDKEIAYAYTDKVLDSIPWGRRVYFHNVHRDGGDFDWMKDNLGESEESPSVEEITALWTFGGRWDPESKIEELWPWIAYHRKPVF